MKIIRYLFTLGYDYSYWSPYLLDKDYYFYDDKDRLWLVLGSDGLIIVKKGYSWNGCSPKIEIMGRIFGTSDGPIDPDSKLPKQTYCASMVHDALSQFLNDPDMVLSKRRIDKIFYLILKRDGFKYASVYYYAVRVFGGAYAYVALFNKQRKIT